MSLLVTALCGAGGRASPSQFPELFGRKGHCREDEVRPHRTMRPWLGVKDETDTIYGMEFLIEFSRTSLTGQDFTRESQKIPMPLSPWMVDKRPCA